MHFLSVRGMFKNKYLKWYYKMIKKADIFVICFILATTLLATGAAAFFKSDGHTVNITVDNEPYGSYSLFESREIEVVTDNGSNSVIIQNDKAYMAAADCRDKICLSHSEISKSGESIVCLPHKLIVEIK